MLNPIVDRYATVKLQRCWSAGTGGLAYHRSAPIYRRRMHASRFKRKYSREKGKSNLENDRRCVFLARLVPLD